MSSFERLKSATSRKDLAELLGYKPKRLAYILYIIKDEDKYTEFSIPKKNGGVRQIKAPIDQLKKLQRRLADLLNQCFDEINKKGKQKQSISHGFRKKHSIITNANKHKNKRHVFNIDLEDFFPSIHFGRIQGFFLKNEHFQLAPEVATTIAQIACHDKVLPQGSPCSPIISNLIGHLLDIRMVYLAKKAKCTYSRYADDLTFSTNKKEFPSKIAVKVEGNDNEWIPGKALEKEIEKVNFRINQNKVSMQNRTNRQLTTGLVVNEKVNIKIEYYKKARSMCHSLFETDTFYIQKTVSDESEKLEEVITSSINESESAEKTTVEPEPDKFVAGTINQLDGILSFIYHVKKEHYPKNFNKERNKPTAISVLYRQFLFYKHFFYLELPLIICEGKTDIILLRCALKQLIDKFPEFIEKDKNGYKFKVQFLNFSKNFKEVFSISEGTSGLASLIQSYQQYMMPFKGTGKKQPVIMLVDNDDGAECIRRKLQDKDFTKPFIYHLENLYVVPIPLTSSAKKAAIEDLFEKNVLEIVLDGKTFNRNEKIDQDKEYGKMPFAKKVVEANQEKIDFSGFEQVLNRFRSVIIDYNGKMAAAKKSASA
jgi:5S rRNA maturation endonuclease (ribonuclease M5)/predicted DNA binding protein